MGEWVEVADLKQLQRRKKLLASAGDEQVALFFVDGDVYALHDVCIHKKRSLSKGLVFQGNVICPGHQWAFDLATGWNDEWDECQPTFDVKVEDGTVFVNPTRRVRTSPPEPGDSNRAGR